MSKLNTIGSGELRKLSDREFLAGLEEMSPSAIDRFRRMRKLSPDHDRALETFLRQHPEKRLTAANTKSANKNKVVKAKTKSQAKPAPKPVVTKVSTEPDGYVKLWMRMRAWWDGVDVETLLAEHAAKQRGPKAYMDIEVSDDEPEEDRLSLRLQIIQQLWGEGNALPGGDTFTHDLLKVANPAAGMTFADLSAGLGGGTRKLAKTFKTKVDGFERDKEIAEAGQEISKANGMADAAPIECYDPEKMEDLLDTGQYDIVVGRDFLYSLPDRKAALSVIGESLKQDGSLVFTDFALADRTTENKAVLAWRQTDPQKPCPAAVDEYRELLTSLRFDVKSIDDMNSEYISAIQAGWKAMVEHLKTGSFSRAYVDVLMQEGQVWLARSRALESGQLRLIKVRAVMKKGPKRALTDSMKLD